MALISERERVIVPQSPEVAVAIWIVQPSCERRINVPPQRISASSGWARRLRATCRDAGGLMRPLEYALRAVVQSNARLWLLLLRNQLKQRRDMLRNASGPSAVAIDKYPVRLG